MKTRAKIHSHRGKTELFETALNKKQKHMFFAREGVDPLTHAFQKKISVHAGFDGRLVPDSEHLGVLNLLLSERRQKRSAVYIHVPFCETHCLYCGFYNRAYSRDESMRFTDALLQEIDIWHEHAAVKRGPIHAVYIGGGTPTVLEPCDLERLLNYVKTSFPLVNDCEITIEGRVYNFNEDKIEACLAGGANRFSVGKPDSTFRNL